MGWVKFSTVKKVAYGSKITMYALDYIDIDDNGVVHGTGIEDFSVERFKKLGFAAVELKNKVRKENPTYKTAYRHELVRTLYIRFNNRNVSKAFKNYLNNRYMHELIFNEIMVSFH
ncbi:MAG: hypothetical protein J6R22_00240 [Alphaproteobacteria bacterium]|nr:hypothetical protein [Alphaproteobacteria bacterium]